MAVIFPAERENLKRAREDSHDILQDYVKRLKQSASTSSDDDILACVKEIKEEIKQSSNSFIRSLAAA